MSRRPDFFVKIELGGQGGAVPLLRWAAPDFGRRVRAARAVGRYACFRLNAFPEAIEPTVTLPLSVARALRKAFDDGVIDPAALSEFTRRIAEGSRA